MKSGKLKKRLYKGVPDAVRGEVWSRLLHIKKTKEEQIGKYEVIISCLLLPFPSSIYFFNPQNKYCVMSL